MYAANILDHLRTNDLGMIATGTPSRLLPPDYAHVSIDKKPTVTETQIQSLKQIINMRSHTLLWKRGRREEEIRNKQEHIRWADGNKHCRSNESCIGYRSRDGHGCDADVLTTDSV